MDSNDNIREIIKIAQEASMAEMVGREYPIGDHMYVVSIENGKAVMRDVTDNMGAPPAIDRSVEMSTLESFLSYYNRFAHEHSSVYFRELNGGKDYVCLGVLDHYSDDNPSWCRHIVSYQFPVTQEWAEWRENNGKPKKQDDFARFIEDHLDDIAEPDGATMLEIATTLQAKNNIAFSRGIRLDNGQVQFKYQEQIDGSAGVNGNIEIPSEIAIGARLFAGGTPYRLRARFRYRINEGQLIMWYDLIQPRRVIEDAVNTIYDEVGAGMRVGHLYRGKIT